MTRLMIARAVAVACAALLFLGAFAHDSGAQGPDTTRVPGTEGPFPAPPVTGNASEAAGGADLSLLAGPVDPATYRLGPGDVLDLEFSGRLVRRVTLAVDAEGLINAPESGALAVAGRSLRDVRAQLVSRLAHAYPGARVELRLVRLRTFKVFIAGQVSTPGVALANAATRASELFHGALALLPDASRRNIELKRRDGSRLRVDLDAFAYLGRATDDPFLDDGDILVVPTMKRRVYVFGAFGRPGTYELAEGDRVGDLVELAGGVLPSADPKSGLLVRFVGPNTTDSLAADLTDPAAGGAALALEDGDRLYLRDVPEYHHARNVQFVGEVLRPGTYAIREGSDHLFAMLQATGGLTADAAKSRIQIYRPSPSHRSDVEFERLSRLSRSEMTEAEYQTFRTKLASQEATFTMRYIDLAAPGSPEDILLRDGDVVFVDREVQSVRVDGQVLRPSLVAYVPGRSVEEYIRLCGGTTRRAWHGKIRLTRGGTGQTLYLADVRDVHPGDFIWVPEKNDVSFWGVFKDVISVAGAVATVIILVRNR